MSGTKKVGGNILKINFIFLESSLVANEAYILLFVFPTLASIQHVASSKHPLQRE